MEKICGIYKITNLINGKIYIGQSQNIYKRWNAHQKRPFNSNSTEYNSPLYRAIRKEGLDNFKMEIITECAKEELNELEIYYIKKYNACNRKYGYNISIGGQNSIPKKLSDEEIARIIQRLKTTLDRTNVIALDFGVDASLISHINKGVIYRQENEQYPIRPHLLKLCADPNGGYKYKEPKTIQAKTKRKVQRPLPIDLAKMLIDKNFVQVAKIFKETDNSLRKWCTESGLPKNINELIKWYNAQPGIEPISVEVKPKKKQEWTSPKRICQIDKQTNEILGVFESAAEAARAIGIPRYEHIGQVCVGKRDSAYGYIWKYLDE